MTYNGKILQAAYAALEREAAGQTHAVVSLAIHIREGKLARYEIDTHRTFIPDSPAGGGHGR